MSSSSFPHTASLMLIEAFAGTRRLGAAGVDHIAQVARERFKVSAAMLSLTDGQRLYFAGRSGTDLDQTILEGSFCATTLSGDDVLVVEDALEDARFAGSALVTAKPHVRFYAGAPISLASGERVGAMCVIDTVPRTFNVGQRVVLKHMALAAKAELERVFAAGTTFGPPD